MNKLKYHKLVIKNIFFTVVPATIFPLIDNLAVFNETSKIVFIIIAIIFIIYQVVTLSLKEERNNQKLHDDLDNYQKYQMSQKILNSTIEVEKIKRNFRYTR